MRKRLIVGTVIAMTSWPAQADAIDIGYENFQRDRQMGRARVILKLTNNTNAPIAAAFVECAFLNSSKQAVDTAVLIGSNIVAGGTAYVDAWSSQRDDIEHVTCRLARYR